MLPIILNMLEDVPHQCPTMKIPSGMFLVGWVLKVFFLVAFNKKELWYVGMSISWLITEVKQS